MLGGEWTSADELTTGSDASDLVDAEWLDRLASDQADLLAAQAET
jgi:hypothetical protein